MSIIAVISIISLFCAIAALWMISEMSGDIVKKSQKKIDGEISSLSYSHHRLANHMQEMINNQLNLENDFKALRNEIDSLSNVAADDKADLIKLAEMYKTLASKDESASVDKKSDQRLTG